MLHLSTPLLSLLLRWSQCTCSILNSTATGRALPGRSHSQATAAGTHFNFQDTTNKGLGSSAVAEQRIPHPNLSPRQNECPKCILSPPPRGEMLLPGMLAVCGQEHVASSEGITHVPVGTQVTNIRGKKIQVRNYRLAAPASL